MTDYSWLKGFNYVPSSARNDIEFWRDYDEALVTRELGYAKRLGFNCARVFLANVVYFDNPEKFIGRLLHFVRTAYSMGIYTLPCVWDSCFSEKEPVIDFDSNEWIPNPGVMYLGSQYREHQQVYCNALIEALDEEPGLLLWDIHNEPWQNQYILEAEGEVRRQREQEILDFVRYYCGYFKEHSKKPVTVGVALVDQLSMLADCCDVLSFHDYSPTPEKIERAYNVALDFSEKWNKPVFCSEMCCTARCNPYDIAIEIAVKKKVGYIVWELMIGKCFWYDRHGIVYPDGTIRDPAIVAALFGFYRRRDGGDVDYNVNTEGHSDFYISEGHRWLSDTQADYTKGLEILSAMANQLDGGNLVPLNKLPTTTVILLQKQETPDRGEIRRLMLEWIGILQADADSKRSENFDGVER